MWNWFPVNSSEVLSRMWPQEATDSIQITNYSEVLLITPTSRQAKGGLNSQLVLIERSCNNKEVLGIEKGNLYTGMALTLIGFNSGT